MVFFVAAEDGRRPDPHPLSAQEREFFIDNLLARIHFIIFLLNTAHLFTTPDVNGLITEEASLKH